MHVSFDNLDAKYIHSFLSPLCNSIPTSSSWSGLITSARMAISLFACWVPWQKLFRVLRQPIKFSFREGSSYPCSCSSVFPGWQSCRVGKHKVFMLVTENDGRQGRSCFHLWFPDPYTLSTGIIALYSSHWFSMYTVSRKIMPIILAGYHLPAGASAVFLVGHYILYEAINCCVHGMWQDRWTSWSCAHYHSPFAVKWAHSSNEKL